MNKKSNRSKLVAATLKGNDSGTRAAIRLADLERLSDQFIAVNEKGILGSNADLSVLEDEMREKYDLEPGEYGIR